MVFDRKGGKQVLEVLGLGGSFVPSDEEAGKGEESTEGYLV